MAEPIARKRASGQGTVEYLGVVFVVAIIIAAGAFAVGRWRPTADRSPPQAQAAVRLALAALTVAEPPNRPSAVRRVLHRVRSVADGPAVFVRAFGEAGARDLKALVRDPIGVLIGGGGDLLLVIHDPVGAVTVQVRAARAYVNELRTMSAHDAYLRVMADAGELTEDLVVARGKRAVVSRLANGARRAGRRTDPGAEPGTGHEGDRTP